MDVDLSATGALAARSATGTVRAAKIGVEMCKQGKWQRALDFLTSASNSANPKELPAGFHSYLGLATAIVRKQHRSAVRYCELGLKREPELVDNYVNFIEVYLRAGEMGKAWGVLSKGLTYVPGDPRLLEIRRESFHRQKVTVSFLDRSHPINIFFGRIRHKRKERD